MTKYHFDIEAYKKNFSTRTTPYLIKIYPELNTEYRAYARKILLKRKISSSKLPWKAKTKKTVFGGNGWVQKETNLGGF